MGAPIHGGVARLFRRNLRPAGLNHKEENIK